MAPDDADTRELLQQLRRGDPQARERLFNRHRDYLRQVIELRMDRKLRGRVDASDVVQETLLEATRRLDDYLQREAMPFRLWLRLTAQERLLVLRRRHVEADCRAVERELALPSRSSVFLAQALLGGAESPSRQATQRETARQVRRAMAELPAEDGEVILLRNFEGLSNQEAAQVLGIEPAAASKRYGRALLRLRQLLIDHGLTGSQP
jgi:RNA polymerase sigma-70 factor (ECF subfamily)